MERWEVPNKYWSLSMTVPLGQLDPRLSGPDRRVASTAQVVLSPYPSLFVVTSSRGGGTGLAKWWCQRGRAS